MITQTINLESSPNITLGELRIFLNLAEDAGLDSGSTVVVACTRGKDNVPGGVRLTAEVKDEYEGPDEDEDHAAAMEAEKNFQAVSSAEA